MNVSATGAHRAPKFTFLFGTASFLALASGGAYAAEPQPAAAAPVEEVMITGSIIRGAPAVGVPVTALGSEDFQETGALTVTDLLRDVPALEVPQESSPSQGGGRLSGVNNVSIHGLSSGAGNEALLLVDGLRVPPQNYSLDSLDPSIIPQIAVQRIDVLTAGASATYGADANSGVINVIVRRNFDGAISQARLRTSTDIWRVNYTLGQLYGRTWDTGGITIGLEWYEAQNIRATERSYYTTNFEPYGLHDWTPLAASNPGVATTGAASLVAGAPPGAQAARGTRYCGNCFAIPRGIGADFDPDATPGPTTTWATIQGNAFVPFQPNTQVQQNIWKHAEMRPHEYSAQGVFALDQEIVPDLFGLGPVALFLDGFYSNRRSNLIWMMEGGDARDTLINAATVPTNNPYRPTGAPANLRVSFELAGEIPQTVRGGEHAQRLAGGFNFNELPFDWTGRFVYSMTEIDSFGKTWQPVNQNNARAALGQTIASVAPVGNRPAMAAYTKPAGVPYLNPFCDRDLFKCNSPVTIDYITGFRFQESNYKIQEVEWNMSGPIFEIWGGPVVAALGFETTGFRFYYQEQQNFRTSSTAEVIVAPSYNKERTWAFISELSIPLTGPENMIPLAESIELSLGYRFDRYEELAKDVHTPKLGMNWNVGWGLTLRGAYGTSFRSPNPAEQNGPLFTSSVTINTPGVPGQVTDLFNCPAAGGNPAGQANPGSLQAVLNPTCSPALESIVGVQVGGGGRGGAEILRGHGLSPQETDQWFAGFNFSPTGDGPIGFLEGLVVDAQYFNVHYTNLLSGGIPGDGINDPRSFFKYTVAPNPAAPNSDPSNAAFRDLLQRLASIPTRGGEVFSQAFIDQVKFIADEATDNIGQRRLTGIDFDVRYDYDIGNWGALNFGVAGYYELDDEEADFSDSPLVSQYEGEHTGNRLQRVRYRVGWTDAMGAWSGNVFARYYGHGNDNGNGRGTVLTCFYAPTFGPGSCYPGSPYYGPLDIYPVFSPAVVEFDLNVAYNTGDMIANPYLHNIRIDVTINNILNKKPPFQVGLRGSQRDGRAFDNAFSDQQRTLAITLTKNW